MAKKDSNPTTNGTKQTRTVHKLVRKDGVIQTIMKGFSETKENAYIDVARALVLHLNDEKVNNAFSAMCRMHQVEV